MKTLGNLLKARDKKIVLYLGTILAAGVLLMLSNRLIGGLGDTPSAAAADTGAARLAVEDTASAAEPSGESGFDYEQALEARLELVFAMISEVGRVKVMVRLSPGRETVYASDANVSESYTRETDAQGGSRETGSTSTQDKTIMLTDGTGVDRPLVLREIEPKVAGVIIIAEGGDNVFVQDALTKAACTVLGIEANKVQILKMKGAS